MNLPKVVTRQFRGRFLIWPIIEIYFMVFSERRGMISTSCFLPHVKILILAEVIASWRSAPMRISIVCAIFTRDFPLMTLFQNFKIDLLQFLSNHLQTFRICSWHVNDENFGTEFWFRLLNQDHGIFKLSALKESLKKHIQDFQGLLLSVLVMYHWQLQVWEKIVNSGRPRKY